MSSVNRVILIGKHHLDRQNIDEQTSCPSLEHYPRLCEWGGDILTGQ